MGPAHDLLSSLFYFRSIIGSGRSHWQTRHLRASNSTNALLATLGDAPLHRDGYPENTRMGFDQVMCALTSQLSSARSVEPGSTMVPTAPQSWQCIVSGPATGYLQMSIDDALFQNQDRGDAVHAVPVIRFYRFSRPCVSLGFLQQEGKHGLPSLDPFREQGWEIVRRPTGGGLVIHQPDDFVFSVVAPLADPRYPNTLRGAHAFVAQAIHRGLAALGITVTVEEGNEVRGKEASRAFCFSRREAYEGRVEGKKLWGGAQRRGRYALLEQGTLLVAVRPPEAFAWLDTSVWDPAALGAQTLSALLGKSPSFEQLVDVFTQQFTQQFGGQMLTTSETLYTAGGV